MHPIPKSHYLIILNKLLFLIWIEIYEIMENSEGIGSSLGHQTFLDPEFWRFKGETR